MKAINLEVLIQVLSLLNTILGMEIPDEVFELINCLLSMWEMLITLCVYCCVGCSFALCWCLDE